MARVSRAPVARWEWHFAGRLALVVEQKPSGDLDITIPHPERVSPAGREAAAYWLAEMLPRLTHDERYALLWGG